MRQLPLPTDDLALPTHEDGAPTAAGRRHSALHGAHAPLGSGSAHDSNTTTVSSPAPDRPTPTAPAPTHDAAASAAALATLAARIDALDWPHIAAGLDAFGCATLPRLLEPADCAALSALYPHDEPFRSRVVMGRHGFGRGEYRYFRYPLPPMVDAVRAAAWPHLAPIANRWHAAMNIDTRFPADHAAFIARCHAAGQRRPTPLLLQYGPGDYNCLHQDLYGEHVFPLQIAILLSEPGRDFSGGEFVLTEQRPRMQSRAEVVPLAQGDGVVFAVHHRPVAGTRGSYRVNLRHGVSRVRAGSRYTLGVIFHDAD